MKRLPLSLLIVLLLLTACKKEKNEPETDFKILTEDEIEDITYSAQELSTAIQNQMFTFLSVAMDSGYYVEYPEMDAKKKASNLKSTQDQNPDGWRGPDANGWYINSGSYGGFDYIYRVRCNDSIVDYEYTVSYDGGDGSFKNETKVRYEKYEVLGKVLYKGYWDWKISTFSDLDISDVHWQMKFNRWNPRTGAGDYDWYWGATSHGGGSVPFHRYLNIMATETYDDMLNVRVKLYDKNQVVWSFEYTTETSPAEMPDFHSCGGF